MSHEFHKMMWGKKNRKSRCTLMQNNLKQDLQVVPRTDGQLGGSPIPIQGSRRAQESQHHHRPWRARRGREHQSYEKWQVREPGKRECGRARGGQRHEQLSK